MLFQTATPDTSGYMIAGFIVSFVVMGLYVLSIYLRNRNLNQDLSLLEEMDKPAAPAPTPAKPAKTAAKPVTKKGRKK